MMKLASILLAGALLGLTGCGNIETHTTVEKETKVDSNGNEKTKIETKTETIRHDSANASTTNKEVKEIKVEKRDSDPAVKLGPIEINTR